MPGGIDTCRQDRVITHINLLNLSIVGNDRTPHILTGVELHSVRIILLKVVTINTLTICVLRTEHVVIDNTFVVVFQTALINRQFFISNIRRRNKAITDIWVDGIGRDIYLKWFKASPAVSILHIQLHIDSTTLSSLSQSVPVIGIRLYLCASTDKFVLTH